MTDIKNSYCWVCYKNGIEASCSRCGIGLHLGCFRNSFEDICLSTPHMDEVLPIKDCQECLRMSESRKLYRTLKMMKFKRLSKQLLNSILWMIFTKGIGIQPYDEMIKKWLKNEEFEKNVSPIIDTIKSKLLRNAYTCSGEFLFDVKKIRHTVKSHMSENPDVVCLVDSYTKKIQENCREMDICPYCVSNHLTKSNGSIEPCPWGHRLVLVDLSQSLHFKDGNRNIKRLENLPPVFPAKIFRIEHSDKSIVVRHFGSLMSIRVPKKCVYLLRSADTVKLRRLIPTLPGIVGKELENSLKMLKLHLMKLEDLYGNSALLADRKRLWHMRDGCFYSRERESSMSKMTSGSSKKNTCEPGPSDDGDDEEINLDIHRVSKSLSCREDCFEASHNNIPSSDQKSTSERMDVVPSPQSFVGFTDTAAIEMVSCTPDFIIPEENQESYPQVTLSSPDKRVQIDNRFEEDLTIEMTDSNEIEPTIIILINQITSETSPMLIDLTQDDEEDEMSKVLQEIEVNRSSGITSALDLRIRNDSSKICSDKSDHIDRKRAEANLKTALEVHQNKPLDLSLQSNQSNSQAKGVY